MVITIAWSCDSCGKVGITLSEISGILYCSHCKMSYGKTIEDMKKEMMDKLK